MLTRVTRAFITGVQFTEGARCSGHTVATVAATIGQPANAAILARARIAISARKLTIFPAKSNGTRAFVPGADHSAHAAILTRRALAKVHLDFAMDAHVAGLAVTIVIVDELHTVLSASWRARIAETFIDVTLAAWTNKPGRTFAFVAAYFVNTSAVVVACSGLAVLHVDFTNVTKCALEMNMTVNKNYPSTQ